MAIKHWEFWPYRWVYLPIFIYYFLQAIRFRNAAWFSVVNPSMKYGGLFGYPKSKMLKSLPQDLIPAYIGIVPNENFDSVVKKLKQNHLDFPLILKPEIGERGQGIEKMNSILELRSFLSHIKQGYLIQEFSEYPEEYGIFCVQMAHSNLFTITSLTFKEFLKVKGDGTSSVRELLKENIRAAQYTPAIKAEILEYIPIKNSDYIVQSIGNHNRGTLFRDGNQLISKALTNRMNLLCNEIGGFRYGRFDIKTNSLEDLIAGKNSHIIELNGVASEPTHIYEPKNSWINGQKVLFQHWKYLVRIAKEEKDNGAQFEPMMLTFKDFFAYRRLIK